MTSEVGPVSPVNPVAGVRVHAMPAGSFKAKQRLHFLQSVALPSVLALVCPLVLPLGGHPAWALGLLLGMWFWVGGVGVSVGLHRHFSHCSFDAVPTLRWLLGALGSMAAQGPVVYWVALHPMHHAASDREGDPHSPQRAAWPGRGVWAAAWQGHLGWVLAHDVPKPARYARDLIGDPVVRALGRWYPACVAAGVGLPAALAAVALSPSMGVVPAALFGAYWGGVVRIALGHHVIWAINSWCHLQGAQPHQTGDHSRNVGVLALLSWGESWHNNHHASPTSARFGANWRQPDVGWWVLQVLVRMGVASLRTPRASGYSGPPDPL